MSTSDERPRYEERGVSMLEVRGPVAEKLARQALETSAPYLRKPFEEWQVLDVGCGFGHTTLELAKRCHRVVGIEPSKPLVEFADRLAVEANQENLSFRHLGIEELDTVEEYDLVLLDNVLEHLPDAPGSLARISRSLKPGGVLYLVVPNKIWPIEHHYHLPFLGYLPLPWANRYLRLSGRGSDYEDASYAPTLGRLRRLFRERPELELHLTPPADVSLTMAGGPWHYRLGVKLLHHFPGLWWISKVFLAVAVKEGGPTREKST